MRHSIDIQGKTLSYLDEGNGFPILFGHSYLWTAQMWRPQIDFFKSQFRCIVPDLWGHGQSSALNETEYSVKQIAEDYHALMHTLGFEEYAVVGLSVGGMWGTQLALSYPNHVRALVIMDSYVGAEPNETLQNYLQLINKVESDGRFTPEMINNVVPLFFSPETLKNGVPIVQQFKNDLAQIAENKIKTITTIGRGIFNRQSLLGQLSKITIPTAVMVGEHDIPRPPKEAHEMAQRLNTEPHVIKNAGHISNLEQPELVNQVLNVIFQKLRASSCHPAS